MTDHPVKRQVLITSAIWLALLVAIVSGFVVLLERQNRTLQLLLERTEPSLERSMDQPICASRPPIATGAPLLRSLAVAGTSTRPWWPPVQRLLTGNTSKAVTGRPTAAWKQKHASRASRSCKTSKRVVRTSTQPVPWDQRHCGCVLAKVR